MAHKQKYLAIVQIRVFRSWSPNVEGFSCQPMPFEAAKPPKPNPFRV